MMPAINTITPLLNVRQDTTTSLVDMFECLPGNSTCVPLVCAWPVSGQYGPGTRIVYYALVGACVLARNVTWLRNACLAAALLFPITAAVHAVVLASVHIDSAVDMDIYGALQFCAIGVLVAPVSASASVTYEKSQGRNIIFVWSAFLLAGLLSLVVEFFRSNPILCGQNADGNRMTSPKQWTYNDSFTCGVPCDLSQQLHLCLDFNAAMLVAAACCIPTVLLPASMWISMLRQNHKKREEQRHRKPSSSEGGRQDKDCERKNKCISEHNEHEILEEEGDGQTGVESLDIEQQRASPDAGTSDEDLDESHARKPFQRYLMGTIFGLLMVTMLIVGEVNLWSKEVNYMTDYMANVGQWAPLVGTGLAILGSAYVLLAQAMKEERKKMEAEDEAKKAREAEEQQKEAEVLESPGSERVAGHFAQEEMQPAQEITKPDLVWKTDQNKSRTLHRVARAFVKIDRILGTVDDAKFENKDEMDAAREEFPEVPGEVNRSDTIRRVRTLSTSRRPSNESQHSTSQRKRSDTAGSAGSGSDKERSSSEAPVLQKRATLDIPNRRRSTQTTLPSRPSPFDNDLPTSSDVPEVVISNESDDIT